MAVYLTIWALISLKIEFSGRFWEKIDVFGQFAPKFFFGHNLMLYNIIFSYGITNLSFHTSHLNWIFIMVFLQNWPFWRIFFKNWYILGNLSPKKFSGSIVNFKIQCGVMISSEYLTNKSCKVDIFSVLW